MLHLHSPYEFTFENKSLDNPQNRKAKPGRNQRQWN